ncbi:MAG: PIN domain-containing protein [Fidelibacterota bacterium]
MKVLVDTSVWSLAFRRHHARETLIINQLKDLIQDQRVQIIGSIRQELLSGIKSIEQFEKLKIYLSAFPDIVLNEKDYELAAMFHNQCRSKGIQGSNTDFLICAVAITRNMSIFTTDIDFTYYKRVLDIQLH